MLMANLLCTFAHRNGSSWRAPTSTYVAGSDCSSLTPADHKGFETYSSYFPTHYEYRREQNALSDRGDDQLSFADYGSSTYTDLPNWYSRSHAKETFASKRRASDIFGGRLTNCVIFVTCLSGSGGTTARPCLARWKINRYLLRCSSLPIDPHYQKKPCSDTVFRALKDGGCFSSFCDLGVSTAVLHHQTSFCINATTEFLRV
ncbi:uncharacterized protein B0T15DRAFT_232588 [Chaetomium strumarium]|uniref:Uncharacterized protein n=1 Tax=Chaetomium strumarium TaxID=1170767 RepID=A0AAJ0GQC0_9PEZI|nr:hypothetical protein B0T15DRAFT_232588 [Chaetomium strumarium]